MIMNLCSEPEILTVIYIAKIIIKLACYVAPLLLIIKLMITFLKVIVDNKYTLNKSFSDSYKRILAAIAIVLIPTFAEIVVSFTGESSNFSYCMNNATPEIIAIKREDKETRRLTELEIIEKERARMAEEEEKRRKAEAEANPDIDPSNRFVERDPITTVDITYINTSDLPVTLYYSDHVTTFSKLQVNSSIANEMHSILYNIGSYVASSPIIDRLETAGAYVSKGGRHGVGLAIDLFNLWTYTDSNKTYTPYSGQGSGTWSRYQDFICNVCNGQENCKYNINYVIFYRFFADKGWCWGGNWGPDLFDPMHYEIPESGYCWTTKKASITCN